MSKYVPLRKFIYDRLYHSQAGYFCKPGSSSTILDFQVGELSQPIKFK